MNWDMNQAFLLWHWLVLIVAGFYPLAGIEAQTKSLGPPVNTSYLLTPARVFDSESGTTHEGWSVLVSSNKIIAAGAANEITPPAGTEKIALPGLTLLPGLMDIHSHIFLHP